jgi:probable DNA metabolism protein
MNHYVYDGSFEGLLTLIFEAYDRKNFPDKIERQQQYCKTMFSEPFFVITDRPRASRVWTGLEKRLSRESLDMVYRVFLSELPDSEVLIFNYVKDVFASKRNIETNFANQTILAMTQIYHKVSREAGRVPMFLRFGLTADGIYYASYEPKYDVLPLVVKHFTNRFADQQWIIFDVKRQYGFYYDLKETQRITFENNRLNPFSGQPDSRLLATDEKVFQTLWKNYFKAINIEERKNLKLQMQHMPKRFWKYLPEKM